MTGPSLHTEHPVDALPEFVRGAADDAEGIERHLRDCADCRAEVALLRALADPGDGLTGAESRAVWEGFAAARAGLGGGGPRHAPWLSVAWKVAAGFALLLTSVGVWRIVQTGPTPEWNPDAALDGWTEELADIDLTRGEIRLALGAGLLGDPSFEDGWTDLSPADLEELTVPWEEER